MSHWVIAPVLWPWLAAILLLLGRSSLAWQRGISVTAVTVQLGLALVLAAEVSDGDILVYTLGNWSAPFGIVLVVDRLSAWMLVVTAFLAPCALLYALHGADTTGTHFHTLFQIQLFGLNGAFLTGDLFNLFVFFEVLLIASYGLLLHGGGRKRTRAGLHFVTVNLIGSTLFLFAAGTFYGVLGTLNLADLALKVATVSPENAPLVRVAGLLLFTVFALKAALLPFYLWLPRAYGYTSAAVAALFAIMTKVGAYSILRVDTLLFGPDAGLTARLFDPWLLPMALATLLIGMVGVLASSHLRQQVAYLVVASVGSLLTAFGLDSVSGITAGLYYLPHTTFAIAALFLLADSIAQRRGDLGDRLDPGPTIASAGILGGLFFIAAVAVAGLPPLSGFIGKFLTLRAALAHPWWPWIMGIVLSAGLIGVIALARTGSLLFYRAVPSKTPVKSEDFSALKREFAPILSLLLMVVGLAIAAGPAARGAQAVADQILQPQRYIQAVFKLGGTP